MEMKNKNQATKKIHKICFIASSGGHLEEIKQLNKLAQRYPSMLITEEQPYEVSFFGREVHYIGQMNRRQIKGWLELIGLIPMACRVLKKNRITHIVTTGAMCAYPYCLAAKLLGIKIIYIESFARVHSASLTGKLVYPIADLFIVQWKELLKIYPKAVYGGEIF